MEMRYEAYKKHPELLIGRFESNFSLIYPGDIAKVRKGGKTGIVSIISQGLPGAFNRDYLIVGMHNQSKNFESYLYRLNFQERGKITESIEKQFSCLPYIDDRVIVTSGNLTGKRGNIKSLKVQENGLEFTIRDEETMKMVAGLSTELNERIRRSIKRGYEAGFEEFTTTLKEKDEDLYEYLEEEGKLKSMYEDLRTKKIRAIYEKISPLSKQIKELLDQSVISVSSKETQMLERFPPNDLFKLSP